MAPSECRQVYRRHGESGAAGTVAASAAVDLDFRHQTLAVRPETAWRVRRSPAGAKQLPWRSVARRPDSAAGREPKVSSMGVLLKPLRFKERHHSREKKRKQTDSRQQTGKTRKGNAGGASARPGFPGAAGARSFEARPDGDRCPLRLLCSRISQQTSRPGFEIDLPAPACDQRSDCVHH